MQDLGGPLVWGSSWCLKRVPPTTAWCLLNPALPSSRCSTPSQPWSSEPNRRTWPDSSSRTRWSKSTSPKRSRLSRNVAEGVAPNSPLPPHPKLQQGLDWMESGGSLQPKPLPRVGILVRGAEALRGSQHWN